MDDDADNRSLAEWAAKDGAAEGGATDAADAAAREAEAAKAAEIFAAGQKPPVEASETPAETPIVEAEGETPPDETPPPADPAKPKKAVKPLEPWIKDRFAQLTAKEREAERREAEARARADVAEAELAELRKRGASGDAPPPPKDEPSADFVPRTQVEARAAEIARMNAFNAQADQAFFAGKAAYKDFETALQPLQAMGALHRMDFQEAALATGAAHDVLYELGSDPDKASQILGYLKSGNTAKATAEMTRLADSVATRDAAVLRAMGEGKTKKTATSSVPPPIRPVGGSALPAIDLDKADDEAFDSVFAPMMKKLGWN